MFEKIKYVNDMLEILEIEDHNKLKSFYFGKLEIRKNYRMIMDYSKNNIKEKNK